MPLTPIYGLPFEQEGDQPLHSLTGGSSGTELILAEEVETQLARIDGDVTTVDANLTDFVDRYEAEGGRVIAQILGGQGTNTTEFTDIPQIYRDLIILWRGSSDGTGEIDSLGLRFNGDAGSNYDSVINRNTSAGNFSSSSGNFTVLRVGHVATGNSAGQIIIPHYRAGGPKYAYGTSIGRGLSGGSNLFTSWAGGRWTESPAVTDIRIWPSGQLWRFDASLTLIGIPDLPEAES